MSEKNYIWLVVVLFIVSVLASFGAGYYVRYRSDVRPVRPTNDEFGKQLEDKQRRIDELEAGLSDLRGLVSDGFNNVSGTVGRVSGQIDSAIEQGGDIRTTISLIREAVRELEKSELYFRGLADSLPDSQRDSGNK